MLKKDVKIGSHYVVRLSGNFTVVRLGMPSEYGGWHAVNVKTGRDVKIKSAAKLRREMAECDVSNYLARQD